MKFKKHPIKFIARTLYLYFSSKNNCSNLVQKSYNNIAQGYDQTWTNHMREKTDDLIGRLDIKQKQMALDLTCGTGYATGLIYSKANTKVIGVDMSEGMLDCAKQNYPECEFINSDILDFLKSQQDNSFDIITCCWGLGYSKPLKVLKEIKRVLKPKGKVGIIDNTIFSLKEIIGCSFLTFMEFPEKLANLMRFRFLSNSKHLGLWFKLSGFKKQYLSDGSKSYFVKSGKEAIERLQATGAAAGFEYAANEQDTQEVFQRFAQIIEQKHLTENGIEIIHRYLVGIATK